MFSSSQDILYIVLSLCALWFTVFLCWLLYQAARVLRNANTIIEVLTHKLELITQAVTFMRDKVDGISNSMGSMGRLISTLAEKFVIDRISSRLEKMDDGMSKKSKRRGKDSNEL